MSGRVYLQVVLLLSLGSPCTASAQLAGPLPAPAGLDFANVEVTCGEHVMLPEPSGPHQVATAAYHWLDRTRREVRSKDPDDDRQIIAQLYYPALPTSDGPPAPYIPELDLLRQGFRSDSREFPRQIGDNMARHGCVIPHARAGQPVDPTRERYPAVLISPGGNMSRHWHTALAEELASGGYVVAVISHAYSGLDVFPRGGFIMSSPYWNLPEDAPPEEASHRDEELAVMLGADVSFVLDRLTELNQEEHGGRFLRRIDLERVAVIGHSRGGSSVARACSTDPRFDACVVYDNIGPEREQTEGLDRPQLVIRRPWPAPRADALHQFLRRNSTFAYDVVVEGAVHMSFTDLPTVEPERHAADLSAARAHRIMADLTTAFLEQTLNGGSPENLEHSARRHAEVRVQSFGSVPRPARASTAGDRTSGAGPVVGPTGAGTPSRCRGDGLAMAESFARSTGTDAAMLVQDGILLHAFGDIERKYRLHSIRKSLLGTLYGVAVSSGTADTARTLASLGIDDYAGLTATERRGTVGDLMRSRSGVFLPATHENVGWDRVRPLRGSQAPGEQWFYSNWDFNALGTAYQLMTGRNLIAAFLHDIAEPLGMQDFTLEDGGWRYSVRSWHPAYVFRMSTRDLARFGQLALDHGMWQGRQVVPSDWIRQITRWHSQATRPDGQALPGVGYGMTWWIGGEDDGLDLGAGVFSASGTGTQLLLIAPEKKLVYVHRNDTDVPASEYRAVSLPESRRLLAMLLNACA